MQPSKGYDPGEDPFYITLQGTDGDEIRPLPLYGMLTDRYGVTWIIGAGTAPPSD